MRVDPAKVSFWLSCASLLFLYGVAVGVFRIFPYPVFAYAMGAASTVSAELATISGIKPQHFLHTARYSGSGVTVNRIPGGEADLIFLSGFFKDTNELRMVHRDGTIVARWPVRFFDIFPEGSKFPDAPRTNWNIDTHGAVALPDGSVVFNFEYHGLVKLDKCGRVMWTLARATHHSVERAAGGGFWVPARRFYPAGGKSPFPPFMTPLREDTLLRVSDGGKILSEISVPRLFIDNGLEALLTSNARPIAPGVPQWPEIVHLNKIAELSPDMARHFPMFAAGDLLLSFRQLNMLAIIDPIARKVKWWRIGPWVRQHDPEFRDDGKIVLFDNNAYESSVLGGPVRRSKVMAVDPVRNTVEILYGGRAGQKMFSVTRGKVQPMPGGRLLVDEATGGRVFETDANDKLIWEYINRYSDSEVAEITEARAYPADYFRVRDWSCKSK